MGVDIRLPIGGMFALLGLLLILYGLLTNGDPMYCRSLHLNANLWWGLAMLVFGANMLYFGRPKQKRDSAP
jgi:membrane-bound ClpP family serine protease